MSIEEIDWKVSSTMQRIYPGALRISFGVIFIWFGLLKPLGLSSAEPLVLSTVAWMPFLEPKTWLSIIGIWEVLIGLCFFFRATTRVAILLLFLQMGGTFLPLFILPEVTFQAGGVPFLPTIEGQYIIKNLMILSAALVLGSLVRKSETSPPAAAQAKRSLVAIPTP